MPTCGYPDRVVHDFRRTAVRNLERTGVPRSTAMKMTEHKTESVYLRYAIVDEAMLRGGAEKLAALHAMKNIQTLKGGKPVETSADCHLLKYSAQVRTSNFAEH
jgi:hypothetical protein